MNWEINDHNIFLMIGATFIISVILVPLIKKVAEHIGAMDIPKDNRRVHDKPMPKMGGVAVFLAFLAGYMFFGKPSAQMNSILIAGILVVLLGIIDDIKPLNALSQFIIQVIAACIVVFYGGIYLPQISAFGLHLNFYGWGYSLAVIFIVSVMNIINLIDGLDGLSSGIASIYYATIAILALILNRHGGLDIILCLIMLGATLGFLVHNFHPAKIFIGEAGTMFLGLMIAVIALLGFKATTVTTLFVPVLILFLPIMDTFLAIIRRLLNGKKPWTPDKEHVHHQLLKLNKSVKKTVLIMYGISILCSAISIFYSLGDNQLAIILYIVLMAVIFFLIFKTEILFNQQKVSSKK